MGGVWLGWAAQIVPTHVGVNRVDPSVDLAGSHCPHTRGGEPRYIVHVWAVALIVPTHVGVKRAYTVLFAAPVHCPHTRAVHPHVCGDNALKII